MQRKDRHSLLGARAGELLQKLIQIESIYEQEHDILAFVEIQLAKMGVSFVRVPYDVARLRGLPDAQSPFSDVPGRYCIVAHYPGKGGGRSLVLNCHLDIVPAGPLECWTHPPFSGQIDDRNVIYGRGAMDDKAGVALALLILERLVTDATQLYGDLIVHFVLEDEVTGNGTLLCLAAGYGGDAAIILDGTRGENAICMHAGNLQFAITALGRPASVSVSHMGLNAAEELFEFLLRLRDDIFSLNPGRKEPWTRFPSPNQFSTQIFNSTGRALTVPDKAEALCYLTFTPPNDLATIRARIENAARSFAAEHSLPDLVVQWAGYFASEPVGASDRALEATMQKVAVSLGRPQINFVPSTGTSDMRHFVSRKIPCVLYGPGRGFNPHRADEHYHLDDLKWMSEMIREIALHWTSEGPARSQTA
jgi:acetylornithine deacetylase